MMNKDFAINSGSATHAGTVKAFNTDAILDFEIPNGHVYMVCDGHDGEQGHAALASKMLVESIKKYFFNKNYKDLAAALTNAISFANATIYNQAQSEPKYAGIGSTIAILVQKEDKVYYAYAGDSRIYMYKNKMLQPLTQDHVEDIHQASESKVTVLVGKDKDIRFGVSKKPITIEVGDMFLLCTDGLSDSLSNQDMRTVITDENVAPEHKCQQLVEKANEIGGTDNVSVQLIQVDEPVVLSASPKGSLKEKVMPYALPVFIAITIGLVGYFGIKYMANSPEKPVDMEQVEEPQEQSRKEKRAERKKKKAELKALEKAAAEEQKRIEEAQELKNAQKAEEQSTMQMETKVEENTEPEVEVVKKPEPKAPTTKTEQVASSAEVYHKHKVVYGDNLYRISLRYRVSQAKLKELNGKRAVNLMAGTELKIPVRAIYKVKSGESFSVVSDKFNIKIDDICEVNKIDRNKALRAGQVLVIPLQ